MTDDIDKLLRRMDTVERSQTDHSRIITEIVNETGKIDARVKVLEQIQQDRRVVDVERNSRENSMQKDISSIQSDIQAIKGFGTWALRLVAGAVILAFVGFILSGGIGGG